MRNSTMICKFHFPETGHAHLRRHNKIAGTMQPTAIPFPENQYNIQDPDELKYKHHPDDYAIRCRLCKIKGSQETPTHIFKECLGVWRERLQFFGNYCHDNEEYTSWNPSSLLGFFKTLDLENKPNF